MTKGKNKKVKIPPSKSSKQEMPESLSGTYSGLKVIPPITTGAYTPIPNSESSVDVQKDYVDSSLKTDSFHGKPLPEGLETSGRSIRIPKKEFINPTLPLSPVRSLKDVSLQELMDAVSKMAVDLGIHGSGDGYSLYQAVYREKKKVSPNDPEVIALLPN